ncbi:response regulator [Candidatus Woesearchaeota archaeon]|nr:response regulator [Candidatus Woesearchaeota archaeon]
MPVKKAEKKTKILIVDDEFDDLYAMKQILDKEDYITFTATNGAKAMDAIEADSFDLILLNIKMPILSGYDVLRLMRSSKNHSLRIVFVSIVPKKEVDMTDIDGFVQKPFNKETLLEGVRKALRK